MVVKDNFDGVRDENNGKVPTFDDFVEATKHDVPISHEVLNKIM